MTRLLPVSLALALLPFLAGATVSTTAAAPALEARFSLRSYESGGRAVFVDAHADRLALRADPGLDPAELAVLVEEAAAKATAQSSFAVSVRGPARLLRPHGLFSVELTEAVPRGLLVEVARLVAADARVLAVYPVLKRGTGRAFADEHLVVTAAPGALDGVLEKVLAATGGELVRKSRVPDTALVRVGARFSFDAVEASRALSGIEGLVSAEPDLYRELQPAAVTDDPLLADQWHLFRGDGDDVPGAGQIFAREAWDVTMGNPAVVVAVFDTGTDVTHEDLAPNVVGGFDAADGDEDPSAECSDSYDGRDYAPSCPGQRPFRESHGTSVSGTIAARGNNGVGVSGVCPMCSLMPVRLLGSGFAQSGLTTAEAFVRAVDDGAWIINNSWGPGASIYFPLSESDRDAFEYARTVGRGGKGTVIFFAAGNETVDVALDAYAASHLTLAISASTNLDDFAIYSNYGREIDVAAPSQGGVVEADSYGIVTTDFPGDEGYSEDAYNFGFGGTSAASPVAAGTAGLVLSANPELTAEQVRLALTRSADKIRADQVDWPNVIGEDLEAVFDYDERGHSIGFGFGRIDAAAAVQAAMDPGLFGAPCDAEGCEVCGLTGRCQPRCDSQADCPDGTTCTAGTCALPLPSIVAVGQPCRADCAHCVSALDTEFNVVEVCTDVCESDDNCPSGFDCRLTEAGGPRICAAGSENAGDPLDVFNCFSRMFGGQILVVGDDGQRYCTDLCFDDAPGSCPYGFHCAYAGCECTGESNRGCWEYTCGEVGMNQSNLGTACFPDEGYGVVCATDDDCAAGDYCGPDGSCRVDDRGGCAVCEACTSDEECGPRGICYGLRNADVGQCTRVCQSDDDCPGDSRCGEVEARFGTLNVCTAPGAAAGEVCDSSFQCEVACRDDVPCPDGKACEDGACVAVDEPAPPGGNDPKGVQEGGCGCRETSPESLLPFLGLLGLLLVRRRR